VKGISNVIALLVIVGIVVALSAVVSGLVLSQISRTAQQPNHLLLTSREAVRIGASTIKVKLTFYNPTNLVFTVCLSSANVYTNGFRSTTPLTLVDTNYVCIKIQPGESGKLEIVATVSQQQHTIRQGVVAVSLNLSSQAGNYRDIVLIPLK